MTSSRLFVSIGGEILDSVNKKHHMDERGMKKDHAWRIRDIFIGD
jgi:hypothetical protein